MLFSELRVSCCLRNNLTVLVHSAEDCCASSMKLWVQKKIGLFTVYLSIISTLFIWSTFTAHRRSSGKYQIRLVRDCQETHPTRKYLKIQKQNIKKHYQKVDIQQSYHIPTISLTITTRVTGTATNVFF